MKILQLNVWMGKIEGNLRRFLAQNDFDIICMQEVFASDNCTEHLARLCFDREQIIRASRLPYSFFSPNWSFDLVDGSCGLGNLILSRIPFTQTSVEFISGEYREHIKLVGQPSNCLNLQIAQLENGLTIANHHGYWQPNPIGNTDTVTAFTKVAAALQKVNGPLAVCGDFNIIHDSPAMRPLDFLRDLTDENHIPTTLSGLKFDGAVPCDHILVNDQVLVNDFAVLPDLVSDHCALTADIELKP